MNTLIAQETPPSQRYAGFWIRLVAFGVDCVIGAIIASVVGAIVGGIVGARELHRDRQFYFALITILGNLAILVYWVGFIASKGQTLGKKLLKVRVIVQSGSPPNLAVAFVREVIGKFISGIILLIGFIMIAFDDKKQALHDRIAKTLAVCTGALSVPRLLIAILLAVIGLGLFLYQSVFSFIRGLQIGSSF